MGSNLAPPQASQVLHGFISGNFSNLPLPSYKAQAYQILHVALSSGPLPRIPKLSPGIKFGPTPGVTNFTWVYIGKTFEISLYQILLQPGVTSFTCANIGKTFGISMYLDTRPRLTKFSM